jgi:hypothetical protein
MDRERYQTQVTEKVTPLVSSTYVRWHMAHRRELLEAWEFPHTQRHGVTLVARADAVPCIQRIVASGCRVYGYDSFTVFPDGKIQPHMEWSPSWDSGSAPRLDTLIADLQSHPAVITHYEFVFESAA